MKKNKMDFSPRKLDNFCLPIPQKQGKIKEKIA